MSNPSPLDKFMDDQAKGIALDFKNKQKGSCECDFHQGRWRTGSLTFSGSFLSGPLVYAKEGDPLPPFPYCNKPSLIQGIYEITLANRSRKTTAKTGYSCRECRTFNEYASSNQPGDKYLCFNCRC